ncbi:hypothetical protein GOP47_0010073 [Adiantum capillus-veneris]|uniref:Uncharacterized protein n=1 Tax=Adiantum capillus-veneris TaxID=13818 RepID=A0A9D4UVA6_ADICA|nr:hypothetical protein GOP47_0010073 [Adiantum capillus-veneris]
MALRPSHLVHSVLRFCRSSQQQVDRGIRKHEAAPPASALLSSSTISCHRPSLSSSAASTLQESRRQASSYCPSPGILHSQSTGVKQSAALQQTSGSLGVSQLQCAQSRKGFGYSALDSWIAHDCSGIRVLLDQQQQVCRASAYGTRLLISSTKGCAKHFEKSLGAPLANSIVVSSTNSFAASSPPLSSSPSPPSGVLSGSSLSSAKALTPTSISFSNQDGCLATIVCGR